MSQEANFATVEHDSGPRRELKGFAASNLQTVSTRGTLGQIKEWKHVVAWQMRHRAQLPPQRRSLALGSMEFSQSDFQHLNGAYTRSSNLMNRRTGKQPTHLSHSQQKFLTTTGRAQASNLTQIRQRQLLPKLTKARGPEGLSH